MAAASMYQWHQRHENQQQTGSENNQLSAKTRRNGEIMKANGGVIIESGNNEMAIIMKIKWRNNVASNVSVISAENENKLYQYQRNGENEMANINENINESKAIMAKMSKASAKSQRNVENGYENNEASNRKWRKRNRQQCRRNEI